MPEFDPQPDGPDGPANHRAPRPALAKRWAVAAAGVAVLAVGLLISPALGSDDDSAPRPTPTPAPTANPAKPAPEATPSATDAPVRASGPVDQAVVARRMDDALTVVRQKTEKAGPRPDTTAAEPETKASTDDSGTIQIVTKRPESYTGSDADLVSSLLDAVEAQIDVDVVPGAPGLHATVDLQPLTISLLGG